MKARLSVTLNDGSEFIAEGDVENPNSFASLVSYFTSFTAHSVFSTLPSDTSSPLEPLYDLLFTDYSVHLLYDSASLRTACNRHRKGHGREDVIHGCIKEYVIDAVTCPGCISLSWIRGAKEE